MASSGKKLPWAILGSGAVVIVLIAILIWILRPKVHPPIPLERDFPEKGYRMLNAPSADGGPGSLQGEDDQEVLWSIASLKLDVVPQPVAMPDLRETRTVSLSVSNLLQLFGASSKAVAIPADAEARETFTFSLINPQHVLIHDNELQQPLLDAWPQPGHRLFDYKRYSVVQEAIMADGINLTLSQDSRLKASLEAHSQLVGTASSTQPAKLLGVEPSGTDQYALIGKFPEPLFVFVNPMKSVKLALSS